MVYSVPVSDSSNVGAANSFLEGSISNITEIGPITAFINDQYLLQPSNTYQVVKGITIDNSGNGGVVPVAGEFLMFSKNKQANTSGVIGYYMSVEFKNNSTDKVELFQIGSMAEMSSK
jgi:hypothetical protein